MVNLSSKNTATFPGIYTNNNSRQVSAIQCPITNSVVFKTEGTGLVCTHGGVYTQAKVFIFSLTGLFLGMLEV